MTSCYYPNDDIAVILKLLTYENALVCSVSLETGLRVSDVLCLKTSQLKQKSFTVKEMKTGKSKRVRLSPELKKALLEICGDEYIFPHRTDPNKHRTRQAVYYDLVRAKKALRLDGVLSPHSMRKNYAVERFRAEGDIKAVQQSLNHSHLCDTLLYALSDELSRRHSLPKRRTHK